MIFQDCAFYDKPASPIRVDPATEPGCIRMRCNQSAASLLHRRRQKRCTIPLQTQSK